MSVTPLKIKEILNLTPQSSSVVAAQGDLAFNSTSGLLELFNSGSAESVATGSNTLTFSNKTIDAGSNTISNLVNANLSSSAGISFSKLASLTSGNILVGNGSNVAASVAMSGDITIDSTGATSIGTNKVGLAQMAQISTAHFLGRATASTGNVESLTGTQATSLLVPFTGDSGSGGVQGVVPAPGSGDAAANKFLKADGTWAVPSTGTYLAKSNGDIDQTSFSAANNQSSAANVTGFSFSNSTVRSFKAQVSVYVNATASLYEVFELIGIQRASDWALAQSGTGDSSGFVFSITSAGQIQYTNSNYTGFSAATVKFRAVTLSV